jgi:hypothetical protein
MTTKENVINICYYAVFLLQPSQLRPKPNNLLLLTIMTKIACPPETPQCVTPVPMLFVLIVIVSL